MLTCATCRYPLDPAGAAGGVHPACELTWWLAMVRVAPTLAELAALHRLGDELHCWTPPVQAAADRRAAVLRARLAAATPTPAGPARVADRGAA